MSKLDLKKDLKRLYNPTAKQFTTIDVPQLNFLMIDGKGDPNTAQSYKDAVEALFSVSYTLKFSIKKGEGIDYTVMPLEGLWWAEDMSTFDPQTTDKNQWLWTMMIMQPDVVNSSHVTAAIEAAGKKKDLPALPKLRFEAFTEGYSVQIMHIGPYSAEAPTLAKLHGVYMPENHLTWNGKHHEIYISDPRKSAPERMKTVLRQPVKPIPNN